MNNLQLSCSKVELTAAAGKPRRFKIFAYSGGKLRVDGFPMPVVVDLQGLTAESLVPIQVRHSTDISATLGQTDPDGIINDGQTLTLSGIITADPNESPEMKQVFAKAEKGHTWQASIGALMTESVEVKAGESVAVNGQTIEGPFILARKSILKETSVLPIGADSSTWVNLAASAAKGSTAMDFEAFCKAKGFEASALTDEQKQFMQAAYDAENKPADENKPEEKPAMEAGAVVDLKASATQSEQLIQASIQRQNEALAANELRIAKIRELASGAPEVMEKAIKAGWSVEQTELEVLRREKLSHAPAGHIKAGASGVTPQILQAAMMIRANADMGHGAFAKQGAMALGLPAWLRAGINNDAKQQIMESAWKYRDMSMVDICRHAVMLDGGNVDTDRRSMIKAAVSGGSLADIFTTNINALMLQKMEEAGDTTLGWTREAEAANFQPMERTRMVKGPRLTKHARGGTADHQTRSAEMESYKISRYSGQFSIDEMDIIDDRFGKLTQDIPEEMAMACGRLRPDLVYAILLANGNLTATGRALFNTTDGNLKASSGSLTSANLELALAAIYNQVENGVNLNIAPTHLLVPMGLFGTAANLLQSPTIVITGTTDTQKGDANPLAAAQAKMGRIEIVADGRLTNGVTDPVTDTTYSGSTTTWRLVSNKVPTIEVAYLSGSGRVPSVRQYQLSEGQWGIGWDVNMDIGAKAMTWRGMYESRA